MILLQKQTLTNILKSEKFQLSAIYFIAFLVPFLFKQPQILIGSTVNFLLIFSVSQFDTKKIIPLLFVPSISSLLSGVLFGAFTPYLLYMIPFIATANFILILSFKYIQIKYLRIVISSLLKASFLFSCAYILVNTVHIPQIFLTTMGAIQFLTALIGLLCCELLFTFSKNRNNKVITA